MRPDSFFSHLFKALILTFTDYRKGNELGCRHRV